MSHRIRACLAATLCMIAAPLLEAGEVSLRELPSNTVYTAGRGSTVYAERQHGPYWSAFAGGSANHDYDGLRRLSGFDMEDKGGWTAGIKIGYGFETPYIFRPAIELEFSYLSNELAGKGPDGQTFRGDSYSLALMANAVLGFDLGVLNEGLSIVRPYVGAGVGPAYSSVRHMVVRQDNKDKQLGDSSSIKLAYQLFGGVELGITEFVCLFAEYRWSVLDSMAGDDLGRSEQDLWLLGVKVAY